MEDIDIENRIKEIYNIVRAIDRDVQWIEDFYEFDEYIELLRSLSCELRLMQIDNNFLLQNDRRYMRLMINAVRSVIDRKRSRLSRRPDFQRRPSIPRRRN